MVHEAVSIQENASMNSKSEHKSYNIARIKVEKSSWDDRKEIEDNERVEKEVEVSMQNIRNKAQLSSAQHVNPKISCRKRKMNSTRSEAIENMDCEAPSSVLKRVRQHTKPCQVPSTSSNKVPNTVVSRRGGRNSRSNVAASNKSVKEWLIAAKNASTPNKPVREETETPVNSPSPTLPSAAEPSNSATSEPNVAPEPQRNEGSAN